MTERGPLPGIYAVFAASGFAALIYQVVWQRALFSIYGINIESVTVVVTAFMVGLGLGGLAGGALSRDPDRSMLGLFALVELGIGVFGFFSLGIIHAVGALTLRLPPWATGLVTFLLVLFPTVLMGATLPLLFVHAVRVSGNVGRSVGFLYFVNTLGSAAASIAAVAFLFGRLGETGSVRLAAALNLLVSGGVFAASRRGARVPG